MSTLSPRFTLVGWQGLTAEIPDDWELSALSGDREGGYVRYDDGKMPRLEIKWSSSRGFVDLNSVIDKYLGEIQKERKKAGGEVTVERDIRLISKRKRKRGAFKSFRWVADCVAHGAGWICKDCGRTVIAQVLCPPDMPAPAAEELAAAVLLGIQDHPTDGWTLWSAYGLACRVPEDFALAGQKLMAGLIELQFERATERILVARWGMASLALKGRSLQEWFESEHARTLRKHLAVVQEAVIKDHPGLTVTGGNLVGVQKVQCFIEHCRGRRYADRLVGRVWHCPGTNKLYYIETFVDREGTDLADELVSRIACHPSATQGADES